MIEKMKAIFFDLDDTLINFGGVSDQAWLETCNKLLEVYSDLKIDVSKLAQQICFRNSAYWSNEESRPKGNTDFKNSRMIILKQAMEDLKLTDERIINFLLAEYPKYKEKAVYVFPKVHETLAALKAQGYQLVLITNGDASRQRGKIARFDLEKYFDHILIEGEQGFGKPDLRIYQKALDLCQVTAKEACMVGDNLLWEVETPIRYGMNGIWLNFQQQELASEIEPSAMIQNVSELLSW